MKQIVSTRLMLVASGVLCLLAAISCERLPAGPTSAKPIEDRSSQRKAAPKQGGGFDSPRVLGTIDDDAIDESSGLVASRTTPGDYWTHNDSGDGPFIYALDGSGRHHGTWRVMGAEARDWEDIAAGPGPQNGVSYLYIGDMGDNGGRRTQITVYRVREPTITPSDANSSKRTARETEVAEVFRLTYPDGAHDAEALMVHPKTGDIYVATKVSLANSIVYKASAPLHAAGANELKRVGELSPPGFFGGIITGGDISPDGSRVALCDYVQGYELELSTSRGSFDEIWKQPLNSIDLGERKQGESIAYRLDGRALLATSEGPHSPLIEVARH